MVASDLFSEFETDETTANSRYLNTVVRVTGTVIDVSFDSEEELSILLETDSPIFGVSCSMESGQMSRLKDIKTGDQITVKGICTGMLSDVVLNRCVVE